MTVAQQPAHHHVTPLEALRVAKGWTIAELARRAGVSRFVIQNIEGRTAVRFRTNRQCGMALAVALGVPMSDILDEKFDVSDKGTPGDKPHGQPRRSTLAVAICIICHLELPASGACCD